MARELAEKLVGPEAAGAEASRWRAAGGTIAFASGVFDLLDVEQVRALEAARARATRLVVGVLGDGAARALLGPGRPVLGARDRAILVASLRAVDRVVVVEPVEAEALVRSLAPVFTIDAEAGAPAMDADPAAAGGEAAKPPAGRDLVARVRGRARG